MHSFQGRIQHATQGRSGKGPGFVHHMAGGRKGKSRARQLNLGLGNLHNSRELLEIGVVLGCLILGLRAMMLCV